MVVAPTHRTTLAIGTERTLSLTTPMRDGNAAATTISRWEATGSYAIFDGGFELAPRLGIGRRAFSVDSIDRAHSPDSDYNYVAIGLAVAAHVGTHVTLRSSALFE